ncbi:MAG: hypothetical protein Q8O05_03345 [Chloroflexota bacterium]|nr:hypothetical protein [Chloroflexota bacterium]
MTKARQLRFLGIAMALAILLVSSNSVAPHTASAAPLGPTNLTATLVNNGRVDLKWMDNSNGDSAG